MAGLSFFLPVGPDGYPPSLHVSAKHTTSVTVSWAKLEYYRQNGPFIGYVIRLYSGMHYSLASIADRDTTSYTIENLVPFHFDYAFSIAVMNEAGVGEFSPPLHIAVQPGMCVYCMYVCLYMHACIYLGIYVCINAHMYTCTSVCVHVYMCDCMHECNNLKCVCVLLISPLYNYIVMIRR